MTSTPSTLDMRPPSSDPKVLEISDQAAAELSSRRGCDRCSVARAVVATKHKNAQGGYTSLAWCSHHFDKHAALLNEHVLVDQR